MSQAEHVSEGTERRKNAIAFPWGLPKCPEADIQNTPRNCCIYLPCLFPVEVLQASREREKRETSKMLGQGRETKSQES
jgi:hypothetical protein